MSIVRWGTTTLAIALVFTAMTTSGCFQVGNPDRAGGGTGTGVSPTLHDVALQGVNHAQNFCQPLQFCASCHGDQLQGGPNGEPSCTQCHGRLWETCGQNTAHDVNLGGVSHASGYCTPFQNCTACHGNQLQGGANGEPSCSQCHGPLWETCGQNTGHTENLGGTFHAPGYCSPYENCTACHGTNLRGGPQGEPSCLQCHDQKKWKNCGAVQHNKVKDGVAHASDWCQPQRDCAPCHGADLRGGPNNEPSCYRCHGDKWNGGECNGGGGEDDDALSLIGRVFPSTYHPKTRPVHPWLASRCPAL